MLRKSDSNMINDETFSSRDEELLEALDLNSHLLSHFNFYATPNVTEFIADAIQTAGVVGSIVDRMVQEGSKKLYDKYIGTKLPNHVMMVSKEYLETLSVMEFQNHDRSEMGAETLTEDPEPVSHGQDSWVRNKVTIEKKLPSISEEVQREKGEDKVQEVEPSESKKSFVKSNASKLANKSVVDIIKEAKKNEMKPVMLPEEIKTVFDPLEEQVRMKKEREMKLKEEKSQEAKQRQEEVKEQQYKLKGMNNENSKKNYTYDYEGNIIPFQPVKIEKLPPSNYTMNVAFSNFDPNAKAEDEKTKKKDKNAQKVLAPIPRPQVKTQPELVKFIASPTIFDVFNANPGVTLIEGGRTKTYNGPKQEKSAFTIMSLSSNLNDTNPIRLSKNEYMQLTRGGNLSRSQNYSSSTAEHEKKQGKLLDEPTNKGNILAVNQEGANVSAMSENLKDITMLTNRTKHRKEAKENNIKVNSNKMLVSLVEEIGGVDSLSFGKGPEKPEKNEEIYKTPIDEFNLHILRSKDWGKVSANTGFLPTLKTGFKPANKDMERALGRKVKYPRDRAPKGITIKEGERLGPPMIGKVAGHGINVSGLS